MYFERITEAVLSEDEPLRSQAFQSLRNDPGIHQLLPYFVQHIVKKVCQTVQCAKKVHVFFLFVQITHNFKKLGCPRSDAVHVPFAAQEQELVYRALRMYIHLLLTGTDNDMW